MKRATKRVLELLDRWRSHFFRRLGAEDGWILAGKLVVLFGGLVGIYITWTTHNSNIRMDELRRAEDSYARLVSDLNSDLERVRIEALTRLPVILTRRVHRSAEVTVVESIQALYRGFSEGEPLFAARLREQFYNFAHSGTSSESSLTARESRSVLGALEELGESGWFSARLHERTRPKDFTWLWKQPAAKTQTASQELARSFLLGIKLRGVDLSGYDLSDGNLRGSYWQDTDFSGSLLVRVNLTDSHLRNVQMYNTRMWDVTLEGALLEEVKCYGSSMRSSNLRNTTFRASYLSKVDFSPLPGAGELQNSDLSSSQFIDCNLSDVSFEGANLHGIRFVASAESEKRVFGASHSNFRNANLRSAVLDAMNLSESDFTGADLTSASLREARLSFGTLEKAKLNQADLSGADLSDISALTVEALEDARGIASCANTNIANIKGLSAKQVQLLKGMGAVTIPSRDDWVEYKEQGFPVHRLAAFERSNDGPTSEE